MTVTHTQMRIWPALNVTPDCRWWQRAWGYVEVAWFIVLMTLAYLPMAVRQHWHHECEATDCAFIEIGVNGTRWLRW